MKKLALITLCILTLFSCRTVEETKSEKPRYYQQYQRHQITRQEYIFLCKGEEELSNY